MMHKQREYTSELPKILTGDQKWRDGYRDGMDLVVEIGPGVGLHPINRAKGNPNEFIVAIERTKEKFAKMQNRVNNHSLTNLHIVHADAVSWIYQNIQDKELSKLFILYPNPYPKKSQSNKRFIDAAHMSMLYKKVKNGGLINTATNEVFYYKEIIRKWPIQKNLVLKINVLNLNDAFKARTHFEKKYLASGQRCFDVTALITHI